MVFLYEANIYISTANISATFIIVNSVSEILIVCVDIVRYATCNQNKTERQ